MSSPGIPSVTATHHHTTSDDWNTIAVGDRTYSLKSQREVDLFIREVELGNIPGLAGRAEVDGHTVTVGGQRYDLERAGDTARLAADLGDGRLDGAGSTAAAYLDEVDVSVAGTSFERSALVVDGQRLELGSDIDVRELELLLKEGKLAGMGAASDLRWTGGKTLTVGGASYDLAKVDGRHAFALDLADGLLDGATAVDPTVTATGVGSVAGPAVDSSGYPTLAPDDPGYPQAWADWMKTHSYEEFVTASESGAIKDEERVFSNTAFSMALRLKGEAHVRLMEIRAYIERTGQKVFDAISQGYR